MSRSINALLRQKNKTSPGAAKAKLIVNGMSRSHPVNGGPSSVATVPNPQQLAGNFSKALALASFERARAHYQAILGETRPMIIGTRLRTRGFHAFYRVRVPAASRTEANALCSRIRAARGACIVLRS